MGGAARVSGLPDRLGAAFRSALESARGDSLEATAKRRAIVATLDTWSDGDISTAIAMARVERIARAR